MNAMRIECNPAIMMGKPVIAGTRITVELILERLSAGETVEQILEAHPRLTRDGFLRLCDLLHKRCGLTSFIPQQLTASEPAGERELG